MKQTTLTVEDYKAALKLAGTLATAADNLLNSNLQNLSNNSEDLRSVLQSYNHHILNMGTTDLTPTTKLTGKDLVGKTVWITKCLDN